MKIHCAIFTVQELWQFSLILCVASLWQNCPRWSALYNLKLLVIFLAGRCNWPLWPSGNSFACQARRGSSIGCADAWYANGHGFDLHVRQYSFVEIGHKKQFYSHSLPSADSRRAVVSYWRKNLHCVLINCQGGLPRSSVDIMLTDLHQ